jgi:DNA-binding MarR family transcriptional regulator
MATTSRKAVAAKVATLQQLKTHSPEALITFRISVLSQLLSRLVDASVTKKLNISSRQWRVLVILNRLGPSTSGDVARMAHFDHSQVSRVSFELAERGLVSHQDDATDRRKQILSLTNAGKAVLMEGIGDSMMRQEQLRGCLSAEEYAVFSKALDALTAAAKNMIAEHRGNTA